MDKPKIDLRAGMVAKKHGAGDTVGYDSEDGLPIIKRNAAKPTSQPEAEPEKSAETKSVQAETPSKSPTNTEQKADKKQDDKPELTKGTPVKLPDGRTGKVAHIAKGAGITRVKLDGGGDVSVRSGALTELRHIQVAAHVRKVPIQ